MQELVLCGADTQSLEQEGMGQKFLLHVWTFP